MIINGKATYHGSLDIPAGRSGEVEIRHIERPAGTTLRSGTVRTAMFGQKVTEMTFEEETRWHELAEDGYGTWMTDYPIEQRQCDELIAGAHGRVLIGGLGLGYAAVALAALPDVHEIVVIERSSDIVALVWDATLRRAEQNGRGICRRMTVVHADLFDYLQTPMSARYDWAFFDIWQLDNESTFHETVVPLRRAARGIGTVVCWNEDVMRAQILQGLQSRWMFIKMTPEQFKHIDPNDRMTRLTAANLAKLTGSVWQDWSAPFWGWVAEVEPTDRQFEKAAIDYAARYGRPEFTDRLLPGLPGRRPLGRHGIGRPITGVLRKEEQS